MGGAQRNPPDTEMQGGWSAQRNPPDTEMQGGWSAQRNPPDTSGHPHKVGYAALHPPYVAIVGDSFLEITLTEQKSVKFKNDKFI
ncbi:MAG: hypothetical protein DRI57_03720 [Deltaproteobacteria bacterium]|nr:MAG: hypothetical protein DRI57_03720 [Deltaproteobacteria bacterium]